VDVLLALGGSDELGHGEDAGVAGCGAAGVDSLYGQTVRGVSVGGVGGGGGGWFETLLAAWMRARGIGRRRRSKRAAQEEEGELDVLEALVRRAAAAAPAEHARFMRAALAAEAAQSVEVQDTKVRRCRLTLSNLCRKLPELSHKK
jgi:hypothetical protein